MTALIVGWGISFENTGYEDVVLLSYQEFKMFIVMPTVVDTLKMPSHGFLKRLPIILNSTRIFINLRLKEKTILHCYFKKDLK